jgi:hypothetical protein
MAVVAAASGTTCVCYSCFWLGALPAELHPMSDWQCCTPAHLILAVHRSKAWLLQQLGHDICQRQIIHFTKQTFVITEYGALLKSLPKSVIGRVWVTTCPVQKLAQFIRTIRLEGVTLSVLIQGSGQALPLTLARCFAFGVLTSLSFRGLRS